MVPGTLRQEPEPEPEPESEPEPEPEPIGEKTALAQGYFRRSPKPIREKPIRGKAALAQSQ